MVTFKARRAQKNAFQVLKDYDDQARLINLAKLSAISLKEKEKLTMI